MKLTAVFYPASLTVKATAPSYSVKTEQQIAREYVERPAYEGETEITPTAQAQILRTNGKRMTADIVVNPIPNNYGLITYYGSTLTVS